MNFEELEYNQFLTNLKSEEVLKIINECLAEPFASFNAELTEMTYDPLYDEFLPHGNASHMWKIEFTLEDDDRLLYLKKLRESSYLKTNYDR